MYRYVITIIVNEEINIENPRDGMDGDRVVDLGI